MLFGTDDMALSMNRRNVQSVDENNLVKCIANIIKKSSPKLSVENNAIALLSFKPILLHVMTQLTQFKCWFSTIYLPPPQKKKKNSLWKILKFSRKGGNWTLLYFVVAVIWLYRNHIITASIIIVRVNYYRNSSSS